MTLNFFCQKPIINSDIMQDHLTKYFLAEKHESLLFMLIGLAAMVASIFLFKKIYKIVEIVLLLAGIAMTFMFRQNQLVYAIAVGLIVQAAIMLVLDLFAEKRAADYVAQIQQMRA